MRSWRLWLAFLLTAALLAGCTNASSYVRDNYPLVDVDGKGKSAAKVYLSEGKTVPETAHAIADKEKPRELSKDSTEQMFLVYDNRIINVQKDPENDKNSIIEIDSIEYARDHYDSSFLQGYLTAVLIDTIFGNNWSKQASSRGSPTYQGYGTSGKATQQTQAGKSDTTKQPSTTSGTGSFTSKGNTGSSSSSSSSGSSTGKDTGSSGSSSASSTAPSSSGSTGNFTTKPSTSSSSSSTSTKSSSSSSTVRKNDGSTPSVKSSSKPSTSKKTGGFSSKRR